MARIEKKSDVKDEIKKMKGEVVKEVRRGTKTRRPKLTCAFTSLAIVAASIAWLLWVVAGTGMMHIPLFSQHAYSVPAPERVVDAGVPFEQVVDEQPSTTLTSRLQAGGGALDEQQISLSIGEDSLTSSFRSSLEELNLELVDSSGAQVMVVADKGFQLFLPIKGSAKETALQVSIWAEVDNGTIRLELGEVQLGDVGLPAFMVASLLSPMIQQYVNELNTAISAYAEVTELEYLDGRVDIAGVFSVEILE